MKRSSADKAYEAIKAKIVNMDFEPTMPLSEMRIAKTLKMTRTPVREAIQRLRQEGLLRVVPHKGTFVNAFSPGDITQIYQIAGTLEGLAARLAAQEASASDIQRLEKALAKMKKATETGQVGEWISGDRKFHEIIVEICGNNYLQKTIGGLHDQGLYRIRRLYTLVKGIPLQSTTDHEATVCAIRSHDGSLAQEITEQHWARVQKEQISIVEGFGRI